MARNRSQRTGRKNNNTRIRELVALLGSLSKTGDSITLDAISSRLGISGEEAQAMVDIVCQASGEEINGLLISSNDEETEYTLQYPGTHGVPIRLTSSETIALLHALDVAGVDEDDPLRHKLMDSYISDDVAVDEVRRALGSLGTTHEALYVCAQARAEQREIIFMYKGIKDLEPRRRRARVRGLDSYNNSWYIVADDLDICQDRKFNVERMQNVELGARVHNTPQASSKDSGRVGITFTNKLYYEAFDWPDLRITQTTDNEIHGTISYYGEASTWLIRRICAGNGCITVDDESIMNSAAQYANQLLGY